MLRPESAAALASTLCSLSPSAAAGQQLLAEVEALLRVSCPAWMQVQLCMRAILGA